MGPSDSKCPPKFPCVSAAAFECHTISWVSIWNSLSSLCVNISSGAGENLIIWHHMIITIPTELWGLITHILVYLLGLLLAGEMTEKEIISLCYLSTFAWIFPTISAVHFLAFALLANFLVQRMCPNRNRRPYELRICDKCVPHPEQSASHICHRSWAHKAFYSC